VAPVPQTKHEIKIGTITSYTGWAKEYGAIGRAGDQNNVAGYERAHALVEVLKKCGDNLTRANVMKQAASLDFEPGIFRPGVKIKTSPTDYQPVKQLYLIQFDGKDWKAIGPVTGD
jgi:branched-chain amino acid transport system substrate-binding protein